MFYAVGFNKYNTDYYNKRDSIHAEVDAVKKLKYSDNTKKVDILVFRTNNKGNGCFMAKPCDNCMNCLYQNCFKKNYKIHRVYYTNNDGNILKM